MPKIIPLRNLGPAFDLLADIGGLACTLFVRWSFRTLDWRVSIRRESDGVYLATHRRISPGGRLAALPHGSLYAFGTDPYSRDDLGRNLIVRFYSTAELADLAGAPPGPAFKLVE